MTQPSTAVQLGARLRALRNEVGATQREVGDALGLAISSISAYEKGSVPPDERLGDYATFLVLRRTRGSAPLTTELTEDERAARADLLRELHELRGDPVAEGAGRDLWTFPPGEPVMLVVGELEDMTHPYSSPRDPNHTDLLTYADLDALVELHGHVRARNPLSDVRYIRADQLTAADDLGRHLVMLGGPGLNERLQQILEDTPLPITQEEHPEVENGEVFYVEGEEPELPVFGGRGNPRLTGDVGLFARLVNPYNSERTLTWCSGIYAPGVLGAVRMLTDADRREQNSAYLSGRFGSARQFCILAKVPVVFGKAITPDLQNSEARLYEWPRAEEPGQPGEARPAGDAREDAR